MKSRAVDTVAAWLLVGSMGVHAQQMAAPHPENALAQHLVVQKPNPSLANFLVAQSADPAAATYPPNSLEQSQNIDQNLDARSRSIQWWNPYVISAMRPNESSFTISIDGLVYDALTHSPRIHAIQENVSIAEFGIAVAMAGFDTKLFMESKFNRLNVPTGSTLDAGFNVNRLIENQWYYN
ncbi:MAG: hypothetical protein ABL921_30445, partial [Pirellula sp.]